MASVLIIGDGAREHAITWSLSKSPKVSRIYVSPGNGGTESMGGKVENVNLEFDIIDSWSVANDITLVVIGPEIPLSLGLANKLLDVDIPTFGPSQEAAQIETSKAWSKNFMIRNNLKTAKFKTFQKNQITDAEEYAKQLNYNVVIKASGLAAGKGVIVPKKYNKIEVLMGIDEMFKTSIHGNATDYIIIEEQLDGYEFSLLAFCDGTACVCMPPAQDYKRAYDNGQGPNTGGMGAYAPYVMDKSHLSKAEKLMTKAISSLKQDGTPFIGCLYGGFMMTDDGPYILEFNARFGDPETQVILPLLKSDCFEIMYACATGRLGEIQDISWLNGSAVTVVLSSGGYPEKYDVNFPIKGLESTVDLPGIHIFHAGTKINKDVFKTSGGRVISVTSISQDIYGAIHGAYCTSKKIHFNGIYYRKDIATSSITLNYKSSGVSIDTADKLIEKIKPITKSTFIKGCESNIGGFGSIFNLNLTQFNHFNDDLLLVSGTDGIGTKILLARLCSTLENTDFNLGIDLVAMSVNDIITTGATPLFFLDYYATSNLDLDNSSRFIEGVARGCLNSNCALVGGETSEMPGLYNNKDYDVAGFAVGAVYRQKMLPRTHLMDVGDLLIGFSSSGIHSNGFSLIRKAIEREANLHYNGNQVVLLNSQAKNVGLSLKDNETVAEVLLKPTLIYTNIMHSLDNELILGAAHITGGGVYNNIKRIIPDHLDIKLNRLEFPLVFSWVQSKCGNLSYEEMISTFNFGIGFVLIVKEYYLQNIIDTAYWSGLSNPIVIGKLEQKNEV